MDRERSGKTSRLTRSEFAGWFRLSSTRQSGRLFLQEGSAQVEINRNQYFLAGIIILLLGVQLKFVDSYVLNEKATQIIAKRMSKE